MNLWPTTLALIAAAGVAVGVVAMTRPAPRTVDVLADVGAALTPELTDPLAVRSLSVVSFDEQAVRVRAFEVASDGKQWTVPSAFNYPADATEKMAQAATAFVGLKRERVVSDNKADHAKLGVLDPTDETAVGTTGRGTRVTMRDASGKVLADLIIGPAAPAAEGGTANAARRYVREAGKPRVYVSTIEGAFSTRFADWVETDLLKLRADQVTRVDIQRYSIDEKTGRVSSPSAVGLGRARVSADPSKPADQFSPWGPWTLEASPGGPPAAGESVNSTRAQDALNALAALRITGVRPKPANLVKLLSAADASVALSPADQASLQRHGFFVASDGALVANEGQMSVRADDGVVYSLWFGELASEADAAASGGQVGGQSAGEQKAGSEGEAATRKTSSRFVMVTTSFDESVHTAPAEPAELTTLKAAEAATTAEAPLSEDQKKRLSELRASHQTALDAHKAKVDEARKRSAELARRFAAWYYLVDLQSLDAIRPTREQLIQAAQPAAGSAPANADTPPFPPTPLAPASAAPGQ
ncbi:MAG: DUF4340 domain-containing protein [Planctomycetaceae bacterium]|jgi:hypothetical protein|nr:DUF4340 domain-containing protein [Phycisphaerales bacterium]MCE2653455.1 DUF4340 domain-containing protein [Planctomycetaceae bacterium]